MKDRKKQGKKYFMTTKKPADWFISFDDLTDVY